MFQSADAANPVWVSFDVDDVRKAHRFHKKGWRFPRVKPRQWDFDAAPIPLKAGEVSRYSGPWGWHMESCGRIERLFGRRGLSRDHCRAWRRHKVIMSVPVLLLPFILATTLLWSSELKQYWRRVLGVYPADYCQSCGYNLTGNTSGICSECGRVISGNVKRKLGCKESVPTADPPKE